MFSQGEREQRVMNLEMLEIMAQGEMTVQNMPIMQVEHPPQTNAESAMGAVAVYDTPPPLLRQNPSSVPVRSAPGNGEPTATWLFDERDMFEALMGKLDTNIQSKMDGMKNEMKEMRGEMQRMGLNLQAGQKAIMAIARDETRAVELKMATPRAGASELRGSVDCVGPAVEDKLIRETVGRES